MESFDRFIFTPFHARFSLGTRILVPTVQYQFLQNYVLQSEEKPAVSLCAMIPFDFGAATFTSLKEENTYLNLPASCI